MDKKAARLQKNAAGMQTELGRMVIQTSELLEDIRTNVKNHDAQAVSIFSARLRFRLHQYRELTQRMEEVLSELTDCVDGQGQEESLLVSIAMLRQLIVQARQEEQNLKGVAEEIGLAERTVETDTKVKDTIRLDQFKKALKESREPHG